MRVVYAKHLDEASKLILLALNREIDWHSNDSAMRFTRLECRFT